MGDTARPALVVGLTGGIASGKSAVAECFRRLKVAVIDTDALAREVVVPGHPALKDVVHAFGRDMLKGDGTLNRQRMRAQVFTDEAARHRLEAILHPWIGALMAARLAAVAEQPYCVVVIPLLVEAGWAARVDRVLVVDADAGDQLQRLMRRDGVDESLARAMLAAQVSRESRLAVADDVLDNSGSLKELGHLVAQLHERYVALSQSLS